MSSVSVDSKFEDRCGDAGTLANDIPTIRAYSPVNRARVAHLFFDAPYFSRTCKTSQVPERTLAHLVRALHPRLHPRTNTAPRLSGKDCGFSKIVEFHLGPTRPSLLGTLPCILITRSALSAERRQGDLAWPGSRAHCAAVQFKQFYLGRRYRFPPEDQRLEGRFPRGVATLRWSRTS